MTDSQTPRQVASADLQFEAKPYAAPMLTELGIIGAVTAGPNNGALDQLGGSSGGFLIAQGTS